MDPMWAQVGVTAVLVGVTIYYAYQVRKSNKNVWQLEEEREKKRRFSVRKAIIGEMSMNKQVIDTVNFWINQYLEFAEQNNYTLMNWFPEIIIYENNISNVGILGQEEINVIMPIYEFLTEIKMDYLELRSVTRDIMNREEFHNILIKIKAETSSLISRLKILEKDYNKLFKGEINEENFKILLKKSY